MTKRPRRLGKIRGLLSLLLFLNVLTVIGSALVRVTGANVTNFTVYPEAVYGAQQANKQLWPLSVEVYVDHPTLTQTILGLFAHQLTIALATIPMLVYARRLVDRAIRNHPFTPEMARGLRRLGLLVLAGGLAAEFVRGAAMFALTHSATSGTYIRSEWTIDFWWLLLGLVILAFAQVVEHGCALRAELDEVI